MKVAVYKNLAKNMYSVQCREGKLYGKVIAHCDAVDLIDPVFTVREAGRVKVIESQKKNVHAFVVGQLHSAVNWQPQYDIGDWPAVMKRESTELAERVKYNPYQDAQFGFIGLGGWEPIKSANTAMLDETGVYAWGAESNA